MFCPYVFLVTSPDIPTLRLQPREVASAHWVPVRALLDPNYRSYWTQDISSRTSRQDWGFKRSIHSLMQGKMLFAAIRLHPSESRFATESEEFLSKLDTPLPQASSVSNNVTVPLTFARQRLLAFEDRGATLLLWGLTLGVVGDFLDMLPPYESIRTWIYPTFTPLDVRFWLWLVSYRFRRQKEVERENALKSLDLIEEPVSELTVTHEGEDRYFGRIRTDQRGRRGKAQVALIGQYYHLIKRAVLVATAARLALVGAIAYYAIRRWRA